VFHFSFCRVSTLYTPPRSAISYRVAVSRMPDRAVILLAEDREDDILLIRKAFERGFISNPFYVVRNGDEVIAYLQGVKQYANRSEYPLPHLLLLDLKMPGTDGFQVLEWIRGQSTLSSLRVVVLTSSENIRDVNKAYHLGANSFLVKPMDFQNFVQLCKTVREYWLTMDKQPEVSRPATKDQFSRPQNS
jgi:CheY-like chemotaxis protein